jgi:hypothetical protein
MLKLRNLAIFATAAVFMAGCGGSNNSTLPNLYQGDWNGSWVGPLANDGGNITWTITSDGSFSGTMTRTGGLTGNTSGIVSSSGQYTATAGFPSSGNFLMRGAVVLDNGEMEGAFSYSWLGKTYEGNFTMTTSSTTSAARAR